jgi:hypothetical protein
MRLLTIAAALGSMVGAAAAQDYPTRPINVIVPAAAGGPTDAISTRWARLRLEPGLDSPKQPEAHLAVIARERDHETHPPVA